MGTYIFPAADASCPLAWVVNQLVVAGFEVASHENIGIQYSETISRLECAEVLFIESCLLLNIPTPLVASVFTYQFVEFPPRTYCCIFSLFSWCDNFVANKPRVVEIVGERWYRVFEVFLGWSTLIAQQGGSTAHMLVCHKNQNKFDRSRFVGAVDCAPVTSNAGCKPNPTLFKSDKYGSR